MSNTDNLISDLSKSRCLLVVTGAGVSVASGVPTFRGPDPDAIWTNDVTTLGTNGFFQEDPVAQWQWYLSRFDRLDAVQPNAAHAAIVELERWQTARERDFLLVTQNIDGLHRAAGSTQLVEVHGTHNRLRCSRVGCDNGAPSGSIANSAEAFAAFRREPSVENLPKCGLCGALMRAHVLWFDESYDEHVDYGISRVYTAAMTSDVVLAVGTSFAVGVTDLIVRGAIQRRKPLTTIDPHRSPPVGQWIQEGAEIVLPRIVEELRQAQT